jgi:hypothetical protein
MERGASSPARLDLHHKNQFRFLEADLPDSSKVNIAHELFKNLGQGYVVQPLNFSHFF